MLKMRAIMAPRRLRSILLLSGLVAQQFVGSAMAADIHNGEDTVTKKVLTPGGFRTQAQVHEIAPGHVLDSSGGRLRELDAAGNVVADFGPAPAGSPQDAGSPPPKKSR
jgi:hypothetical protein